LRAITVRKYIPQKYYKTAFLKSIAQNLTRSVVSRLHADSSRAVGKKCQQNATSSQQRRCRDVMTDLRARDCDVTLTMASQAGRLWMSSMSTFRRKVCPDVCRRDRPVETASLKITQINQCIYNE